MITVNCKSLLNTLRRAKRVTDKRASLPILGCVVLEFDAESGELLVHATDLERHAVYHVATFPAERPRARKGFAPVAVQADRLVKVMRVAKAETVELDAETDPHALTVSAGRARFKLLGFGPSEAPAFPLCVERECFAEIPAEPLRAALDRVEHAMSTDETRYNLNAVSVGSEGARSVLTATDGHRLCQTRASVELPLRPAGDSLIPRLGVADLLDALKGQTAARVWADPVHLFVQSEDALLALRWVDGEAPNYSAVVEPALRGEPITLPRAELLEACGRVALIANEDRSGRLVLSAAEDNLTLRAEHPDVGVVEESIPVNYVGPAVKIGVNVNYLADTLERLVGCKVSVTFKSVLRPMALRGNEDPETVAVIMPLRVWAEGES